MIDMEITPGENNNHLALITPETQPNKRRRKKSMVWDYFTIENVSAGCRRAYCKRCKQSFAYSTGSKVAGTTTHRSPSTPFIPYDQDRCHHEIARMFIMHEYPLHMVEHPGFITFVRNIQPQFDKMSFNTVQGDCVATYLREKQSLMKFIEGIPGRFCLTLDMWSSNQTLGYVFITGHFVDMDWKLHRRVFNVIMEPYQDSHSALSHAVAACLSDWSLEGKLFSLTFNHPLSEAGMENLRPLLCVKNPLILNGQLLIGNCIAHTMSSMAKDVLAAGEEIIKKIRHSVKYVKMYEDKFIQVKNQLQVPSEKNLFLDNQTQWSTTYQMLAAASELKEVFDCLDGYDPDYKLAPSLEDWKLAETLCSFLKPLFDAASIITTSTQPTAITFFHEVWRIHAELGRSTVLIARVPLSATLQNQCMKRLISTGRIVAWFWQLQ
ncbi:Zinc finger BED domain-containing protein DAYSLEEPER [Hibiscus syriacus]|uniref:Zinc finger BED domain-containing protein DAYSLEEPER n=1 Tax=Hibiscus syriacus TaxID=106335 RepID=A0A6A2WQJ6_HIBSY|nr:Zinc finger BED domain-containing protein DAYSLEEPER [Hibiscus syriacus]